MRGKTVIVLPGWSAKNKVWKDGVCEYLNKVGFETIGVDWKHWGGDHDNLDFAYEIANLKKLINENPGCSIVAKSIGTVILGVLINDLQKKTDKIILCGVPLKTSDEEGKTALGNFGKIKQIIVFQNDQDPYGLYAEVAEFFGDINVVSKVASNHDYPYYEEFKNFLVG